ncbi:MAG TPA: hypothetical protein VK524_18535 [Polyangiaceae bacterium]|nr:hypothetical protein [Polyangiaceae bacterium]
MKQFLGRSPSGLFATQTLTGHVIRGAVAFALLYLAIEQQHLHPVASLLAGLLALVAMRGCPVCWTIGLAETIRQRYGVTRSLGMRPTRSFDAHEHERLGMALVSSLNEGRLE